MSTTKIRQRRPHEQSVSREAQSFINKVVASIERQFDFVNFDRRKLRSNEEYVQLNFQKGWSLIASSWLIPALITRDGIPVSRTDVATEVTTYHFRIGSPILSMDFDTKTGAVRFWHS